MFKWRIEVALAGWSKDEIEVSRESHLLSDPRQRRIKEKRNTCTEVFPPQHLRLEVSLV